MRSPAVSSAAGRKEIGEIPTGYLYGLLSCITRLLILLAPLPHPSTAIPHLSRYQSLRSALLRPDGWVRGIYSSQQGNEVEQVGSRLTPC